MLFDSPNSHSEIEGGDSMLIAVIQEVEDEKTGKKKYIIDWHQLLPEKRISMMALHRRWTDSEIRILIKYRSNLKRAAKILGRSYGAVRVKWSKIRKELGFKRETRVAYLPFPEPDLSLRKEVIERLLPRGLEVYELSFDKLKETLANRKDLTFEEHVWLNRALEGFFHWMEKWQTGKEHLEIYKDEKEHADQPENDEEAEELE